MPLLGQDLYYARYCNTGQKCLPPELAIMQSVGQGVRARGVLQGNTEWHRSVWQPVVWVQPSPHFSKERAWRRSARHHVGSFGVLPPSPPVCIPSTPWESSSFSGSIWTSGAYDVCRHSSDGKCAELLNLSLLIIMELWWLITASNQHWKSHLEAA